MFSRRTPAPHEQNRLARAVPARTRPFLDLTATNPTSVALRSGEADLFDGDDIRPRCARPRGPRRRTRPRLHARSEGDPLGAHRGEQLLRGGARRARASRPDRPGGLLERGLRLALQARRGSRRRRARAGAVLSAARRTRGAGVPHAPALRARKRGRLRVSRGGRRDGGAARRSRRLPGRGRGSRESEQPDGDLARGSGALGALRTRERAQVCRDLRRGLRRLPLLGPAW